MLDPKPSKRVVSKEVAKAILGAEPSCRVCGQPAAHAHHLVRRSQSGDDVAENLIALCARCHRKFHDGKEEIARAIRRHLLRPEIQYIVDKKGRAWFDKVYPYGDLHDKLPLGDMRIDKTEVPSGRTSDKSIAVPTESDGRSPVGPRGQKLGPSAAALTAANESDVALSPSDSASGQESSPAADFDPMSQHRTGGGEACKRCHGSGEEPRKLATTPPKPGAKTSYSIKIPVAERKHGADDLRAQVAKAGELLSDDLGYDAGTPAYYIVTAVLHDWIEAA